MDRRAKAAALEMLADTSAGAPQERLWGITELCAEFALSPRAIRFYEDKGLLAPRRINGARVYGQRERARLKIIQRAKAIGSSLDEIKHFLDLYGAHGEGRARQLQWTLERTGAAIAELEEKRSHIDATLAELRLINESVRQQLAAQETTKR
ncbi:MerR family DNA-binding transcriptional regulator [Roseateles sp. DAIF2]|uniref:MerR family transcriptional regulator n=1 Tax=Roseateles sp. DAIF2 TaxID=2714952 RepID=UPI0018A33B74|nr:MerR family DNA-binding transcriptional regulator [Roseateles sp. DAIF2]QPF72474.1 MerR family DNA-binding transcriptional regulator [Roseateles sp. DAIF2]